MEKCDEGFGRNMNDDDCTQVFTVNFQLDSNIFEIKRIIIKRFDSKLDYSQQYVLLSAEDFGLEKEFFCFSSFETVCFFLCEKAKMTT